LHRELPIQQCSAYIQQCKRDSDYSIQITQILEAIMSKRYSVVLLGLLVSLFVESLATALPGIAVTDAAVPPTTVSPGTGTEPAPGTSKINEIIDMGSIARNRPVARIPLKFKLPANMSSFKITAAEPITHFGLSSTGGYLTSIPPNREVTVQVFPRSSQEGTFSQVLTVQSGNIVLKRVLLKVTILPPANPGHPVPGGG
jgi:hypothetical protein